MTANVRGGRGSGRNAAASKAAKTDRKRGGKGRRGKKPKRPKKQKKKHKCGDSGSYGNMTDNYRADGKERDHVPSCAALIHNAKTKYFKGVDLCPAQVNAIKRAAQACVIPKGVHEAYSKTFRHRNTAVDSKGRKLYERDAKDKQKAAKRDTAAIKKGLKKKNVSKECQKKYAAWARKVNARSNRSYGNMIKKAVNGAK